MLNKKLNNDFDADVDAGPGDLPEEEVDKND